jgi:type I restriction enzyme S subunit
MTVEMKDSGIQWIGEIPKHWKSNKIGSLYDVRATKVSDKVYPPLSVTKFGIVPQLETAAKTDDGDNRKLVLKGDFVINSRSDRRGSCGISEYNGSVSLINTIISPRTKMSHKYYDWLFHTERFADEFYKWGHGIVDDLWTTRWQEMKSIAVIVPPINEQEKIASFLDTKCGEIDELVDLETQMIDELKAYKQSIITEAVTRGLNPNASMRNSGIEWIGEIPQHWSIVRLKSLGWTQNGISQSGDYFGEEFEYPFVSYSDVYNNLEVPYPKGRANSSKVEQYRYSLKEGDILFTRTSETIEEIGFCATCMHDIPKVVFSGFLIRFRPTDKNLYKGFSKYYFRSNIHRRYFVKEMNLVTRASLGQDLLKSLTVLLPPLNEQQEIAKYLDSKCADIDALIALRQEKIDTLKEYKKSLIFEYVTGKKQVV